uniref:Uncharacterized protein n=1 Tax=Lepeophtheirus salmonis TaxID=72036 RepID=A0A0K2TVJ4_LEPSM
MAMGSDLINYSTKRHHIWKSISCIHEKGSFAKKNPSICLLVSVFLFLQKEFQGGFRMTHHFHLDANVKEV